LQAKLLRVIQEGEFERLGNPRTLKVDVRIIAATNRNLRTEVGEGRFREDLYYRLNVFPITVPPLRERKDDIPLLVEVFVAKFNKKLGRAFETVEHATLALLQEHDWPGNVRELESVIERAVITSQGSALRVSDRFEAARPSSEATAPSVKRLDEIERDQIALVLRQTGWRIEGAAGAALILGLNPSTLRGRMRKLDIRR
jgi:transcriptional regulator with GAF, ATPase, and Fis domain